MYRYRAGHEESAIVFCSWKLHHLIIMLVAIVAIQHPVDFQDVAIVVLAFNT